MKKIFTTDQILYFLDFCNKLDQKKSNDIGIKARWKLKKVMDLMVPVARQFEEFKASEVAKIRSEFVNDEKSELIDEEKRDIKEEYKEDFQSAVNELNKSIEDMLKETHEFEYDRIDMDSIVNSLPDDTTLSFDDISVIALMLDN